MKINPAAANSDSRMCLNPTPSVLCIQMWWQLPMIGDPIDCIAVKPCMHVCMTMIGHFLKLGHRQFPGQLYMLAKRTSGWEMSIFQPRTYEVRTLLSQRGHILWQNLVHQDTGAFQMYETTIRVRVCLLRLTILSTLKITSWRNHDFLFTRRSSIILRWSSLN